MDQLQIIQNRIYEFRGQKVMLDCDLAEMYGVQTKVLNQAVKRNIERFPSDVMFQISSEETQDEVVSKRWHNLFYILQFCYIFFWLCCFFLMHL
ncbi:ORF6N domain-containing protein, partial [Bacteroides ovatus]